jgi:SAM-dependent methyltransferase
MSATQRTVLHVGCGRTKIHEKMFPPAEWREIRLDVDPDVQPDIVASLTDMSAVPSASADAVYCCHNLEHLYAHEVPVALAEFLRVLRPGGLAVIEVPDLEAVAQLVTTDRLEETIVVSPYGPISALDLIYGNRWPIADGNHFMAHRTGFTTTSLGQALQKAGFVRGQPHKLPETYATIWQVWKGES